MKLASLIAGVLVFFPNLRADSKPSYTDRLAELQNAYQTNKANPQLLFELGHLCHQQAITGDASAVKLAEKYLIELKRVAPTNAFGQALLGSAIVMKARDAFLPTSKLKLVRQGCAEIDEAVERCPTDANVRFTRASNNLFLPDLCGRKEIVRRDLEWLDRQAAKVPASLPVDFRQYVALFYGTALQKWGDATGAISKWNNGIKLAQDSPVADEIRAALRGAEVSSKSQN